MSLLIKGHQKRNRIKIEENLTGPTVLEEENVMRRAGIRN